VLHGATVQHAEAGVCAALRHERRDGALAKVRFPRNGVPGECERLEDRQRPEPRDDDIVKEVRGRESNCEHDSRKM
jgi:hypothetical protein